MATIICNIGSRTADNVTVNSVTGTNPYTLTLSATVPSTTIVGDKITDNGTNDYIITGVSGSDLTVLDQMGSATAPVTGAATTNRAYTTLNNWELGSYACVAGDDAVGKVYGTVTETGSLSMSDGTPDSITITAADPHSGQVDVSKSRILFDGDGSYGLYLNLNMPKEISWLQFTHVDPGDERIVVVGSQNNGSISIHHNIVYSMDKSNTNNLVGIFVNANTEAVAVHNNLVYDFVHTHATTGYLHGIQVSSVIGTSYVYNNTVTGIDRQGTQPGYGIVFLNDDADLNVDNNLVSDITSTDTAGCYYFAGTTNLNEGSTNGADDATSPNNGVYDNMTITFTGGGDYTPTGSSDVLSGGTDLGTTPTDIEIDLKGRDRDAEGDTWSLGAIQYVPVPIDVTATDGFDMSDSASPGAVFAKTATDGFDMSDSSDLAFALTATDGFEMSDTTTVTANLVVTASDGVLMSDTPTASITFSVSASDGFVLSDLLPTAWHDASSMEIIVGSITAGTLGNTHIDNNQFLHLAETSGTPGYEYVFKFGEDDPVASPRGTFYLDGNYDGNAGHNVKIMEYNYNTTSWVNLTADAQDLPSNPTKQAYRFTLIDDTDYISNGVIQLKVIHNSAGNINHDLYLYRLHLETAVIFDEVVTDGFVFADGSQVATTYRVTATDGFALGETIDRIITAALLATDGMEFGDSDSVQMNLSVVISDGVNLADIAAALGTYSTTAQDGIILSDVSYGSASVEATYIFKKRPPQLVFKKNK